ncbi:molybdopterin dehydrogenase, partial [Mycobacterium sp. ITM-2017-0098]
PSDMAVALAALDAVVRVTGPDGARAIAMRDFFVLPGDHPERENAVGAAELITGVELPPVWNSATVSSDRPPGRDAFRAAAAVLLEEAIRLGQNGFKVTLAENSVVRALTVAAA